MNEPIRNILKQLAEAVGSDKPIEGDVVTIVTEKWLLQVTLKENVWSGLQFTLFDQKERPVLYHEIDTDLYDLKNNSEFVDNIEQDIYSFIKALESHQIRIGAIKGREAMLIPDKDKFILIKKGIFFTARRECSAQQVNDKFASFEPI